MSFCLLGACGHLQNENCDVVSALENKWNALPSLRCRYYYNTKTQQSSWEKPAELMTPSEVRSWTTQRVYLSTALA